MALTHAVAESGVLYSVTVNILGYNAGSHQNTITIFGYVEEEVHVSWHPQRVPFSAIICILCTSDMWTINGRFIEVQR